MSDNIIDLSQRLEQREIQEDDEFFENMGLGHLNEEERDAEITKIQQLMNITFMYFINMQRNGLIPKIDDTDPQDFAAQLNFIHANALSVVDFFNGQDSEIQEDIDLYYGPEWDGLIQNFLEFEELIEDHNATLTIGVDEE